MGSSLALSVLSTFLRTRSNFLTVSAASGLALSKFSASSQLLAMSSAGSVLAAVYFRCLDDVGLSFDIN